MRSFSFHAKTIGKERYLTYIMGEGMELDEDTLDFMEDEMPEDLVRVIFEQDEDYDYLTYDISGKVSLQKYTSGVMNKETVLKILRNVALGMINCKEQALHLAYILLHKDFIYVDQDTMKMQFICLPVEGEASVSTEFKSFVRQLIANFKYDLEGDVSYVGTLLAFINGDTFNLRNLIGLTEALMEDEGIDFEAEDASISTEDGEVVDSTIPEPEEKDISSFMNDLGTGDEALPEIGDDEEEDEVELSDAEEVTETEEPVEEAAEEVEEAAEEIREEAEEPQEEAAEELQGETEEEDSPAEEEAVPEEPEEPTLEELAEKAKRLAEEAKQATRGARANTKNIKVSRAAIIQNAAAQEAEIVQETGDRESTELLRSDEVQEYSQESKNAKEKRNVVTEDIAAVAAPDEEKGKAKPKGKAKKEEAAAPAADVSAIKVNPYLIRETTEERTMITKNVFKIGKANRGVDYHVSGNGAISRQHAIITKKDDGYYIKDNKSTNHTYVNGKELEDGEEVLLSNNTRIRLGDEEFLFKY